MTSTGVRILGNRIASNALRSTALAINPAALRLSYGKTGELLGQLRSDMADNYVTYRSVKLKKAF